MERADRAELSGLPGAFSEEPLGAPGTLALDEENAHHLRVRRLEVGEELRVTDGRGRVGRGLLTALARRGATLELTEVRDAPPPSPVCLHVPVADRDRMLWLAEKSVEMGLGRWAPVRWERSRSVSPRGEGEQFRAKVRSRMVSALVQCGGAWLPEIEAEVDGMELVARTRGDCVGRRLLLDASGEPLLRVLAADAMPLDESDGAAGPEIAVALGPEGGLTAAEVDALVGAGFRACALGSRVLRFETAALAALALVEAVRERDRWAAGDAASCA